MTETHSPPHPPEQPALTTPPRRARAGLRQPAIWIAGLALFVVLLLAWQVWQGTERIKTTRQELARRLADSDAQQREAQANARQNREALDALQAKVGALEARLVEMQGQQLALETMYQELSRVRDDRLLAEVEQAVNIAAQQLQLAGNVEAALIALSGAEARLAKSAQPQFLPLRKLIVRDIERLKTMPGADVPGIALRLDAILDAVPNLPLAFEQRPAAAAGQQPARKPRSESPTGQPGAEASAPEAPTWQNMVLAWLGELWGELRQLVRIERIDRPDPGLLAPREIFFLRENLRLRLLSARLALLARDGRSFQGDLQQADAWLERYFDTRAPAVAEARQSLKSLGRLDVMRAPGDLNETLAALRNFKLARDRGPAR
jgi:uroporphyrin-3 C-methyltransferase